MSLKYFNEDNEFIKGECESCGRVLKLKRNSLTESTVGYDTGISGVMCPCGTIHYSIKGKKQTSSFTNLKPSNIESNKNNNFVIPMILIIIAVVWAISSFSHSSSSSSSSSELPQSGQSITLSDVTPVCSSKENLDKLLSYIREKNNSGIQSMYSRGEVKDLQKGTKVNVTKAGIVTEIETSGGQKWYAPMEAIK